MAARGSYSVGIERRERILAAATENFAREGYLGTSMADIARDVGLTSPGLMHYFPTKQHVLVAVAERRFDLVGDWAHEDRPDIDGTGPFRNMVELTRRIVNYPGLIELFVSLSAEASVPDSPAHELYARRYQIALDELSSSLRRSAAAGYLRPDIDFELIARQCIAVTDGAQLQWVISGGKADIVHIVQDMLEHIAAAMRVDGQFVRFDD
ncbi:MAG: TetR/AcrR family transcriptional regulator [Microbacteriaceae bacterium]